MSCWIVFRRILSYTAKLLTVIKLQPTHRYDHSKITAGPKPNAKVVVIAYTVSVVHRRVVVGRLLEGLMRWRGVSVYFHRAQSFQEDTGFSENILVFKKQTKYGVKGGG